VSEQKFGPPDFGDMDVDLTINGTHYTLNYCNFRINGKELQLSLPLNYDPGIPAKLVITLSDWRGESDYSAVYANVDLLDMSLTDYA
jgi:hypothetical protein